MNSFNVNKVMLLMASWIKNNKRVAIKNGLILCGVLTLFFVLFLIASKESVGSYFSPFVSGSYIIAAVFSVSYFSLFHDKRKINTTHLLPASKTEKFVAQFLLSIVVVPFAVVFFYFVVMTVFWAISLLFGSQEPFVDAIDPLFIDFKALLILLMLHATGVFSGVIFKKRQYVGYLYYMGLIFLYVVFLVGYVFKKMFPEGVNPELSSGGMDITIVNSQSVIDQKVATITLIVSILYVIVLWVLSYRFFRKIQLNR